jgi:hypothetical protein
LKQKIGAGKQHHTQQDKRQRCDQKVANGNQRGIDYSGHGVGAAILRRLLLI